MSSNPTLHLEYSSCTVVQSFEIPVTIEFTALCSPSTGVSESHKQQNWFIPSSFEGSGSLAEYLFLQPRPSIQRDSISSNIDSNLCSHSVIDIRYGLSSSPLSSIEGFHLNAGKWSTLRAPHRMETLSITTIALDRNLDQFVQYYVENGSDKLYGAVLVKTLSASRYVRVTAHPP